MVPVKQRRRGKAVNPEQPAASPGQLVCKRHEYCEGCPYPRHGFICWHGDGSCMKTDMERLNRGRRLECDDYGSAE